MSATIITASTIKSMQAMSRICVALSAALAESHASETEHTRKGRAAMLRIGGFILAKCKSDNAKVPFWNIDSMLAFVNNAKQTASNNLQGSTNVGGFLGMCADAKWHDMNAKCVNAAEAFQAAWQSMKEVKVA